MNDALMALPSDFVRRLSQLIPQKNLPDVIAGFTTERVTTFRVNTIKTDAETLRTRLASRGIIAEQVSWLPGAFILKNSSLRSLTELTEYHDGLFYVQSLSSMIPALILDPKPGERILDIAAAPGSKTTQIAALMENTGEIVANDTSQNRIYRLEANLKTQGVTIAKIHKGDGRSIWQQYPEYFDKTLVDAPCSLEGRFSTLDPKSYADWSLKKVRDLSLLERWLLRSAVSSTKKGGIIIYATCTLSPEENEGVVDWLLGKDKHAVEIESVSTAAPRLRPPILTWGGKPYNAALSRAVRVYPTTETEGFFVVRLKKIHSTVPAGFSPGKVQTVLHQKFQKSRKRNSRHF